MIASSFLTSHALVKTLHFTTQSAVESGRSISPIRVPIDSIRKKKKRKGKIHSPVTYPPRHLPPLPFSDSPQMNDRAAFPPPVARGVCMFHLEARSNYRLGEYRASGIRIPVDGPSYCEYRFQPGKKQICPRLLLPSPKEKQSRSVCAGLENIYICIRKRDIFS